MTVELMLFYLLAAFTVALALMVVLAQNIVRAAVALIFSFCGLAGLYVLLDAEFLAAVQVLIYVGGITILLLFAILLTSRIAGRGVRVLNEQKVVSGIVAVVLMVLLGTAILGNSRHAILEEPGNEDLAEFLARHGVEVVASLPCYSSDNVDRQRGKGVFEASIRGLRRLNELGYGRLESGLVVNLVYNPQGPSLPPAQAELELDYKRELRANFGVEFDQLYTLANMPIQRFGSMLISKGQFNDYMAVLKSAHREDNLDSVMCRTVISVDWQGYLYDCDFNQMLELPLVLGTKRRSHVSELIGSDLTGNPIEVRDHCYGCTAGQGSSCGGALHGASESGESLPRIAHG